MKKENELAPSTAPIVVIESPFAGEVEKNVRYARAALRDCLERGEAPYASHLLYTQDGVLDDTIPEEREHGIQAGFVFRDIAEKTVVYGDLGITKGMQYGIDHAEAQGHPIEYRSLPEWENATKEVAQGVTPEVKAYLDVMGWLFVGGAVASVLAVLFNRNPLMVGLLVVSALVVLALLVALVIAVPVWVGRSGRAHGFSWGRGSND